MADDTALTTSGDMNVTVVTPRGVVAHGLAQEIVAQGALGEFGVLPGHIPYLTMLDTGVLMLGSRGSRQVFAHGPGYLEVGAHGKVEVLVEQTAAAEDIDVKQAQSDLTEVEAEMKALDSTDEATWKNLRARHQWALARIEAARRIAS